MTLCVDGKVQWSLQLFLVDFTRLYDLLCNGNIYPTKMATKQLPGVTFMWFNKRILFISSELSEGIFNRIVLNEVFQMQISKGIISVSILELLLSSVGRVCTCFCYIKKFDWLIDIYFCLPFLFVYNKIHSDCSALFALLFKSTVNWLVTTCVWTEDRTVHEVHGTCPPWWSNWRNVDRVKMIGR